MTALRGQLPKAYLRIDPNLDHTHPDPGGFVRLLSAANRQPHRGRFKSKALLAGILGKTLTQRLIERRDVVEIEGGRYYVEGWDEWQEGDFTVGERMRRMRNRRNGDRNMTVTDTVTESSPDPPDDRNSPSEASRRLGVKALEEKAPTATAVGRQRVNGLIQEPRLTKQQLDSWQSFTALEWQPFKEAWLSRDLLYAPFGSPDDDDTSQRGLLWQIAEYRPHDLAQWVREAPKGTARETITYILERWHEVRADAGVDEDEWEAAKVEERRAASGAMTRLGDVLNGLRPEASA